jgi:ribosomal protein S5
MSYDGTPLGRHCRERAVTVAGDLTARVGMGMERVAGPGYAGLR